MSRPWPAGAVTGVGSLPGADPVQAARLVTGELPSLPHLVELPARGAGAEMIGRTCALLVDLPAEIVPTGWRLTSHPGRDLQRARDFLAWDLDAIESACDGLTGALKVQCAGPWTLAASMELASGHHVVGDAGAVRDLAESLAEGLRAHVAEIARRVPGASVVLQLDEPSLTAVIDGMVSTPSGYGRLRPVAKSMAAQTLADVLSVVPSGARAVHCCARRVPVAMLRDAGADAVSLDAVLLDVEDLDALGEAIDAGMSLWLGVVATDGKASLDDARSRLLGVWDVLGFPRSQLADSVVPTPTCGLAGLSLGSAREALNILRDVGKAMVDASH